MTQKTNSKNMNQQVSNAKVLESIVSWSKAKPLWQRDALRRLCMVDNLGEEDYKDLLNISKGAYERSKPITCDHISDSNASTKKVNLNSINNVQNVNALAGDQNLSFTKTGLTVIYGNNGSGKSGYTRILKQVCRARNPKNEMILPNIYDDTPSLSKAIIKFAVNEQNKETEWIKDQVTDSLLSSVSVFDSSTASVHVDSTNDVAYVPFPMELLGKLADACKHLKSKLQNEIDLLLSQTPDLLKNHNCSLDTKTSALIKALNGNTDKKEVEKLASFLENDSKRLEQLSSDFANNPIKKSKQIQAKLGRLNSYIEMCNRLYSAISDESAAKFNLLIVEYKNNRKAASLAAGDLFKKEPLSNVGGDVWKILWEAARKYSQEGAYPNKNFPVVDKNSFCVLCQQPISVDATNRMRRFESFVTDDAKQQEVKSLQECKTYKTKLKEVYPASTDIKKVVCFCENEIVNKELASGFREFLVRGKWRLRGILRYKSNLTEKPLWPLTCITSEFKVLQNRINELVKSHNPEEQNKLKLEKAELEDCKWLSVVKEDVLNEIERKKQIEKLEIIIRRETNTVQITTEITNISKKIITKALRTQFAKEVNEMGLGHLAIELKQENSKYGVPQFKVALTRQPSVKVGQVLSEGEFSCIALSAFLAELATTHTQSAIVFDDPVSSLDHMHRENVSKRLAKEALKRQVIIFTHDIDFLFLLGEVCDEANIPISYRHITKRPMDDVTGLCHNNVPPKAQKVTQRINSLSVRLQNEKRHYNSGNETKWSRTVRSLKEDIRFTWERAVEDFVSVVLKRFSNQVKTQGLSRLTVLTLNDCDIMRKSYGRCAMWLHSDGISLNRNLPKPDEIDTEIKTLHSWYEDVCGRQNKFS